MIDRSLKRVCCAFHGFTPVEAVLGSPGSLVCSPDWSFLVPLHPLVATLLHAGVISFSFNSVVRMERVCVWGRGGLSVCPPACLLGWAWVNKGRRQGSIHRKLLKAQEARPPAEEWRPGFLLRRQGTQAGPASCAPVIRSCPSGPVSPSGVLLVVITEFRRPPGRASVLSTPQGARPHSQILSLNLACIWGGQAPRVRSLAPRS